MQSLKTDIMAAFRILRNKEFAKRFFLLTLPWFAVGTGAYGIHFAVKFVQYNIFATAVIKDVTIIVCILIAVPIFKLVND